jgi:Uma2 family endonuclease
MAVGMLVESELVESEEPMQEEGPAFTRADLEHAPNDGRRYEVIDGVLIVSAAPGRLHQRAVKRAAIIIDAAAPSELEVLFAPFAVALADDTEMQPDLVVGRRTDFTDRDLPRPPVLAVEVLSASTRMIDLHLKRARFERAGTPYFWIIDPVANPANARMIAWELGDDGFYRKVADKVGKEVFTTALPFPMTVVPAELVQ